MLRTSKWKVEKTKVKVVFRLQFHATNIPQSGWDKLFVCFIPAESGKIIAKTSKANVRNGSCKWADPIYETTRLVVDSRNKRYDDKLYNLIVGMGTSHASILGEATINLADYADALNPFVISLPLHGSDQGTILHVTVQLLTAKTGFREFEQQFDKGLQSTNNYSREVEPNATTSSSEFQMYDDHENKVYTRTHLRSESKELESIMEETTDTHQDFSESYDAVSDESRDLNGQIASTKDDCKDNKLAFALEENDRLRGSLEMAESLILELRKEVNTLHNHANEMNIETQKIAQHLTQEISSGLKLEREVMALKSECSKFKDELQQLNEIKIKRAQFMDQRANGLFLESQSLELLGQLNEAKAEKGNLVKRMNEMECYYESLVQELEENRDQIVVEFQKLRSEHGSLRLCMKDQILKFDKERLALSCVNEELEKRVMVTEAFVQELEENQERVMKEFESLKNEHSTCGRDLKHQTLKLTKEKQDFECLKNEHFTCVDTISSLKAETESIRCDMKDQTLKFAKEKHELEKNREEILGELKSLQNEHSTCGDTILTYKNMNDQLVKERHDLGRVNEELKKTAMTTEALVQELEEKQQQILVEFESLKNEHSTCGDTILTYKNMNDHILRLEKERHDLGRVNEELKNTVMTTEALVQELEEKQQQILVEFESLKIEHSTCGDSILTYKNMNDQILRLEKERHDLGRVNEELKKRVMTTESLVQELEEKQQQLLGEFESLKNEHSTCGDTIIAYKNMNDQILRLEKERHDLGRVNEELKKTIMTTEALVQELEEKRQQILGEFESLKIEHSTCHDLEDQIVKSATERHALSCFNKELEEKQQQILGEFQSLKDAHSTCGDTISTYKSETESIRHDLEEQILKITDEKQALICVNKELEKKVTALESALERGRVNYSVAVTHLQKDLDMLSAQVSSMFESNQKLIKQRFSSSQNCPNLREEVDKICCERLYLDVYSVILEGTLLEVSRDANKMKEHAQKLKIAHDKNVSEQPSESLRIAFMKEQCETAVQELKQQLFVSKRHSDDTLIKLQDALDEIDSRKKSEASYLKKIEELSFKIGGLEGEFQSIQAELDCALLNLECCREEKEKIVAQIIELEKMKNERSILTMMSCGSCFQDLQRELMQLHKANEELEGMYPRFKDFTGDGNALGRVLALEIELAGALIVKKKSNIQFQSSFLKQHSDEEAIFRSFRDINELIKDTLEIKSKYVNVETELNEMHERYSRLSLQLAEVEGERQKLMMIVKNVR